MDSSSLTSTSTTSTSTSSFEDFDLEKFSQDLRQESKDNDNDNKNKNKNVNGWNDNIEFLIYKYRRHIEDCSREHLQIYKRLWLLNALIKIPLLVFSALSGSVALLEISSKSSKDDNPNNNNNDNDNNDNENTPVITIVSSSLSICVAILTALNNALSLEIQSSQHLVSSRNFSKIAIEIDVIMVRRKHDRENAISFLNKLISKLNNIAENSPPINLPSIPTNQCIN